MIIQLIRGIANNGRWSQNQTRHFISVPAWEVMIVMSLGGKEPSWGNSRHNTCIEILFRGQELERTDIFFFVDSFRSFVCQIVSMTEKAQMCLLHCQHIQHCYIATRATSLFLPGDLCYWWPRRYEHTSPATTAAADLESCEQNLLYLWLVSTPRPVLSSLSDPWHCASVKPNFCLFANFVKPVNN